MTTMLAALAMAVVTLPFAADPAQAAIARSSIIGPQGFPRWYEDADGQRLELCLDSIACSTTSALLTPAAGGEAVYWAAVAAPPAGLTGQGLEMEVSAGFDPTSGRPVVTGRIRIRVRDLVPGEQYTLTHPYGQAVATAQLDPDPVEPDDLTGRIRYIEEVGCILPEEPADGTPPPPAPPCDFSSPLAGPLFEGFLRQPGAPAGHLGEGLLALTPRPVVNGLQGNSFQVEGPSVPQGAPPTTDFLVEGRLAAPVTATMSNTDFGTQKISSSVTRTVAVRNTSTQPVTLDLPRLAGPGSGDFTVGPAATGGCSSNAPLAARATCQLSLTFQPSATGLRTATLSLPNSLDGDNLVRSLTVTGTGARPRAAIRSALDFGDVGVGQRKTLPLTISNPGDVNLVVTSVLRTGSPEFTANATACTSAPVRARRSCVIDVTYRPTALGRDGASLAVVHDAAGSSTTVTLSGRAVDATAPAVRTLRMQPGRFDPPAGSASVVVGLDGPGRATVQVLRRGRVVRNLGVLRFEAAGNLRTTWNGRDNRGRVVDPGTYLVRVTARDRAGNASVRSARVTVVR
jgi:Abnormal spindle-like microcephaly-assoc'd, ASPM-SPD-2-Hydin